MGSEMCIRDRPESGDGIQVMKAGLMEIADVFVVNKSDRPESDKICLLYTSDAADERSSVDLGGRRIIKKKSTIQGRGRSGVIKTVNDTGEYKIRN